MSLPPCSNFLKVGFRAPRTFVSIGSRALIVLERALALTTHTRVLPKHMPALKNDMWDAMRFARFSPAIGSIGSRASRGKVMT